MDEIALTYKNMAYFLAYCGDSNPAHSNPEHVKKILNMLSQKYPELLEEFKVKHNENAVIVPGMYLAQHIEDLFDNLGLSITDITINFTSPLLIKKEDGAEKKVYRSLTEKNNIYSVEMFDENNRTLLNAEVGGLSYFGKIDEDIYKSLKNGNATHLDETIRDSDVAVYKSSLAVGNSKKETKDTLYFMVASYLPKHLIKLGRDNTFKIYIQQTLKFDRVKHPTDKPTIYMAVKKGKTGMFKIDVAAENSKGFPFMTGTATVLEKEFTK